jgi:hypothetical protein
MALSHPTFGSRENGLRSDLSLGFEVWMLRRKLAEAVYHGKLISTHVKNRNFRSS